MNKWSELMIELMFWMNQIVWMNQLSKQFNGIIYKDSNNILYAAK